MALTDAEQKDLLDKVRTIYREVVVQDGEPVTLRRHLLRVGDAGTEADRVIEAVKAALAATPES